MSRASQFSTSRVRFKSKAESSRESMHPTELQALLSSNQKGHVEAETASGSDFMSIEADI